MNRAEALELVLQGKTLIKHFTPENDGVSGELEVWIRYTDICTFSRRRQPEHDRIGPYELRFWEAGPPHWIHVSREQVEAFIERNFLE